MSDQPHRILFVEDDIGKRYVISRQLRAAGFQVDEAGTGREGLALVSTEHDVAVIDMKLPDMWGWDLCKKIKTDPRTSSVMVLELSATLATPEDRARGLELGADAYLVHPVELVELLAAIRALIRLRAAERERERHRELFLGTVGHDLRNPLHTILSATDLLSRSPALRDSDKKVVATIDRTASRMRRLIDQLLIFTQGVAGGVPVVRETVDLGELARSITVDHQSERNIVVDSNVSDPVSLDPHRVGQLLDNLVTNAIRYGTGPITIKLDREPRAVVIAVHNAGPPIPPEAIPTLFDPYRRVAKSGGGVGLGLYIVDQIARAHGGSVMVGSTEHSGTTFTIRLPTTVEAPQ